MKITINIRKVHFSFFCQYLCNHYLCVLTNKTSEILYFTNNARIFMLFKGKKISEIRLCFSLQLKISRHSYIIIIDAKNGLTHNNVKILNFSLLTVSKSHTIITLPQSQQQSIRNEF